MNPRSLDMFARCALDGCATRVYAPLGIRQRCRKCGGTGLLPEIPATDAFGRPASAGGPPPPPAYRR